MSSEISPSASPDRIEPLLHLSMSGQLSSSYRHLALAVIERALRDMMTPACSSAERASAHEFLGGSPAMRHWCRVAELDPRRVIDVANQLIAMVRRDAVADDSPPRP
jgi:hypothetical protein